MPLGPCKVVFEHRLSGCAGVLVRTAAEQREAAGAALGRRRGAAMALVESGCFWRFHKGSLHEAPHT